MGYVISVTKLIYNMVLYFFPTDFLYKNKALKNPEMAADVVLCLYSMQCTVGVDTRL